MWVVSGTISLKRFSSRTTRTPCSMQRLMRFLSAAHDCWSRPSNGSSRTSSSGPCKSALQIRALRISPVERNLMPRSRMPVKPIREASSASPASPASVPERMNLSTRVPCVT